MDRVRLEELMSIYWPYEIFVGSEVLTFSFRLPEALVAVFTESDRVPLLPQEEQDDEHSPEYHYEATVKTIRDRLEIMGYTSVRWRVELDSFRQKQMEQIHEQIMGKEEEERGHSASRSKRTAMVVEHSPPSAGSTH